MAWEYKYHCRSFVRSCLFPGTRLSSKVLLNSVSSGSTICVAMRKGRPGPRLKKTWEMVRAVQSSSGENQRKERTRVPEPSTVVDTPLSKAQRWHIARNTVESAPGEGRNPALRKVPTTIQPLVRRRAVLRDFLTKTAMGRRETKYIVGP